MVQCVRREQSVGIYLGIWPREESQEKRRSVRGSQKEQDKQSLHIHDQGLGQSLIWLCVCPIQIHSIWFQRGSAWLNCSGEEVKKCRKHYIIFTVQGSDRALHSHSTHTVSTKTGGERERKFLHCHQGIGCERRQEKWALLDSHPMHLYLIIPPALHTDREESFSGIITGRDQIA